MNTVYLGLGSNLGQRDQNISNALELLAAHDSISVIKFSSNHETLAVSSYQQPKFLNSAAEISTLLTPFELLEVTEGIEKQLGRTTKGLGDPRIIDIDILFYNHDIISTDQLTIPHALTHERLFVIHPLCEIAPTFEHPVMNISIEDLKHELQGY
jgi:2-amino-4-hydroxy-6-hydroxymethyldihydropteridine diphosphokinase